jgi:hypothetical protein
VRQARARASEETPRRRTWGWGSAGRLPPTNRGVEITTAAAAPSDLLLEFAVHELTGTTRLTVEEVLGTLAEFDLMLEQQQYGSRIYRRRWTGEHGVTVQADNKMGSDEVHVRLPGQVCEHLGFVTLLSLGTLLNLKVTRLDAAIDYCPFTPRHLLHAQELGLSRTHAQSHGWASNGDGDTFTLGSGKSDVYLRCYDRRGFTRSELQLRRGHAQEFFAGLLSRSESEWPELFLGALRSFVDFVDTGACENISRAPLLGFWRAFVGMVDKVKLAPARVQSGAEKYLRQARKYAAMFHVYGSLLAREGRSLGSVLGELYTHGAEHLRPHHRLLLARGVPAAGVT